MPAMPKNYYTHVYESKDVSKIMSQMANSFQSTKNVSNGNCVGLFTREGRHSLLFSFVSV